MDDGSLSHRPTVVVNLLHAQEKLTGTGFYALELTDALAKLPNAPRIVGICNAFNRSAFSRLEGAGVELLTWGHAIKNVMVRRLEEWAVLQRTINRLNADVFWGPSNFLPWIKPKCRLVATIHDMTFFAHPETMPFVQRTYWHAWTHRTIANADAIVTATESARADLKKYGNVAAERVTIIPHGVAERFFVARDEAGREARASALRNAFPRLPDQYVLFVGTITPHKNVIGLLEAAAKARASGCPQLRVVLGGKRGFEYERVADAVRRLNLGDAVTELGYVSDDLLPALYENARIHVLPSLTEGFGLPLIEAMACGTPVITGDVGSVAEVVGEAGTRVDIKNATALGEALAKLWSNEALHGQRREAGIIRADQFTWRRAAERTLAVLLPGTK